jgi:hypothetical protein
LHGKKEAEASRKSRHLIFLFEDNRCRGGSSILKTQTSYVYREEGIKAKWFLHFGARGAELLRMEDISREQYIPEELELSKSPRLDVTA